MKTPKKSPPDNVGNMRGRIYMLKSSARLAAGMAAREDGVSYDQVLIKELKKLEPELKKLHARLAKAQKGAKAPASKTKPKKAAEKPKKVAEKPQKRSKKRSATRVPKDYDDLLETLGNL